MSKLVSYSRRISKQTIWIAVALVVSQSCVDERPTSPDTSAATTAAEKAAPRVQWLAYPRVFTSGAHLGAIAVTPRRMLGTTVGPAPAKLVRVDADGRIQPLVPAFKAPQDVVCHLALATGREGWADDDVLVSLGSNLWRLRTDDGSAQVVVSLPAEHGETTGLCFDPTGDFRNDLLVLTSTGSVLRVGPDFVPASIGSFGAAGRGPSVLPMRKGARLVAAFPESGRVLAMDARGVVSNVGGWSGVSAALAFPQRTFAHAGTGAALFVATSNGQILMFDLSEVGPRAGALLLTSVHGGGSGLATPRGSHFQLDAWSRHRGPEVAAAFVQIPSVLEVDAELAPDLDTGPLTLDDPTPVRVAVLGASWFEAAWVDAASVRLAAAAPVIYRKRAFSFDDVNDDGDPDLVLAFRPSDMEIDLRTTSLVLSGRTLAGDALRGRISVRVSDGALDEPRLRSRHSLPAGGR